MPRKGLRNLDLGLEQGGGVLLNSPKSLLVLRKEGVNVEGLYNVPLRHFIREYAGDIEMAKRKKEHCDSKREALLALLIVERNALDFDGDDEDDRPSHRAPKDVARVLSDVRGNVKAKNDAVFEATCQKKQQIDSHMLRCYNDRVDRQQQRERRQAELKVLQDTQRGNRDQQKRAEMAQKTHRMLQHRGKVIHHLEQRRQDLLAEQDTMLSTADKNRQKLQLDHERNVFLQRRSRQRRLDQAHQRRDQYCEARLQQAISDVRRHDGRTPSPKVASAVRSDGVLCCTDARPLTPRTVVRGASHERERMQVSSISGKSRKSEISQVQQQDEHLNYVAFKMLCDTERKHHREALVSRAQLEDDMRVSAILEKDMRNEDAVECLYLDREYEARCRKQEKSLYLEDHQERTARLGLIHQYRIDCLRECLNNKAQRMQGIALIEQEGARERARNKARLGKVQLQDVTPGPGHYLGQTYPGSVLHTTPAACFGTAPPVLQETYGPIFSRDLHWWLCRNQHPEHTSSCCDWDEGWYLNQLRLPAVLFIRSLPLFGLSRKRLPPPPQGSGARSRCLLAARLSDKAEPRVRKDPRQSSGHDAGMMCRTVSTVRLACPRWLRFPHLLPCLPRPPPLLLGLDSYSCVPRCVCPVPCAPHPSLGTRGQARSQRLHSAGKFIE